MESIHALSLVPVVNHWLAHSHQPRILHLFARACNLINEHGEILSIVTPQVGNGPFNLVIQDDVHFDENFKFDTPIMTQGDCLHLGNLTIDITRAKDWDPRPNWENLHHQQEIVLDRVSQFPFTNYQSSTPHFLLSTFSSSLANADIPSAKDIASNLAGLGIGLTPAGDDFIMGALYAAWIIHPSEIAGTLAEQVAETAAPLTTSLSAAWLRSAGMGEAGNLWHEFFDALLSGDAAQIQTAVEKILAVGATSGADALSGFMNTFLYDRVKIQHG